MRRTLVVLLCCVLAVSLEGELTFTADQSRIDQALAYVAQSAPTFAAELTVRRQAAQPLFVIVPGILGSRLLNERGEVFWGEKGLLSGFHRNDLELTDRAAKAEFLAHFQLFGSRDVYGRLRDHLKFHSLGARKVYLEFPYDWRQDIRATGSQLHEFLQAQRPTIEGRDVVFIAHSMGGLAVRSWYHEYYAQRPEEYGFLRPPRIFFLGTPHYGSASALLQLVGGYGSDSGLESITKYFMKDLNDVSFSFMSVFQLLPFTQFSMTFRSRDGQESTGVDLYSSEIWRECRWGKVLRIRQHVDEAEFYDNYLPKRLLAARSFHEAMLANSEKPIPDSICFFSDGNAQTPAALRIEQTKNGCEVRVIRRSPGDGRVVAEYTPFDPSPHHHSLVRHLASEHGALPRDLGFLGYIDEMRTASMVGAILASAPTPVVYHGFRRAGSVLPVPAEMKDIDKPATQAILAFNRFVFASATGQPLSNQEIARRLYALAKDAPDYSDTSLRLYALSVAFHPRGEQAVYAANHLSDILLRLDRWHAALDYSEHALSLLSSVRSTERDFLSHVHENAGVAFEKAGRFTEALREYGLARSKDGKRNRTNLERKLGEQRLDGFIGR